MAGKVGRIIIAIAVIAWLVAGFLSFGQVLTQRVGKPASLPTPTLDEYGGDASVSIANDSGYFQTKQVGGKWWLVTPAAHAFYSLGVDGISTTTGLSITDSYAQAVRDQYPSVDTWAATSVARLKGWGFNTIGAWSNAEVEHRGLPHSRSLRIVADMPQTRVNWVFPDVFDPAWEQHARERVAALISDADVNDKWLLGWYLDNELWWYQDGLYVDRPNNTVVENYIAQPPTSTAKLGWVSYIESRYSDIAALNKAWGTQFSAFRGPAPDTLQQTAKITALAAEGDKMGFLGLVADRFFRTSVAAVRARDPHHLILGVRFLPQPVLEPVADAAAKYVDVLTVNIYNKNFDQPDMSIIDHLASVGKPVMITEFTARSEDSGMVNGFLAPGKLVPSQAARADAYRIFMDNLLQRPAVVGAHWFIYADEPPAGSRAEQGNNWGLVDNHDQPYQAFVDRVANYNRNLYAARRGHPDPNLSVPSPITPAYDAAVFAPPLQLAWNAVGAGSYTLQLARTPDFHDARSYSTVQPYFILRWLEPGRWYWRIRADSSLADNLAYTSAWPFYVYQIVAQRNIPTTGWQAATPQVATITPTHEISTSYNLEYTGGLDPDSNYASISRTLSLAEGDWRSYDFLATDLASFAPADVNIAIHQRGADNAYVWSMRLAPGSNHLVARLTEATTREVELRRVDMGKVGAVSIALRAHIGGQSLIFEDMYLIRVAHDTVDQPPITPIVQNVGNGDSIELDWSSYQPVTTTVGYNLYVSDQPIDASALLTPTLRLDAATQHTRVRIMRDAAGKLVTLPRGQTHYFAIAPVDAWGRQ